MANNDEVMDKAAHPKGQVRAMEVGGHHHRKPPVVFDPSEDVDDIEISVPRSEQEDAGWGERRIAFSQSANDKKMGRREWTHYVQVSEDVPRRFRMALVHEHPSKHPPQYYTLEYTDYGKFRQNDPELVGKLPAEVYQAMLGMSVALREVKLMTLQSLHDGEFPQGKDVARNNARPLHWQPAPGIYGITISDEGGIESQWEMGIAVSREKPAHYRSFARNIDTGQEVGLFDADDGKFLPSQPGLKEILPQEVYSGLVGLAVGCRMARELTLEMHDKGEVKHNPHEKNKNRGYYTGRVREQRQARDASQGWAQGVR